MRHTMKKWLLMAAMTTCFVVGIRADRITQAEAMRLAESFVGRQQGAASVGLRGQGGPATGGDVRLTAVDVPFAEGSLYVFNKGRDGGFVIVAADDRAVNPIVGYADEGAFPVEDMPEAMKGWLKAMAIAMADSDSGLRAEEIFNTNYTNLHESGSEAMEVQCAYGAVQKINAASPRFKGCAVIADGDGEGWPMEVEPLLGEIAWNQQDPYNRMTPLINGTHALTGCVATATAQIMYYHRWPERGTGSFSYDDRGSGQTLTANFGEHVYDWDAMMPRYDNDSPRASGDAVALLMSDVGISVCMNYSLSFSGAATSDVVKALRDYFGYDNAVFSVARRHYNYEDWTRLMRRELAAGRPLVYSGSSPGPNGGHAFVCDGYNADDYFHFNWGWSGSGNGWFLLTTMNPNGGDGFTDEQEMVCNIARPGEAGDTPDAAFNWEFDEATGTLRCYGDGVMPSYGWMPEEKPWYDYRNQIKHIVVEEGITSVGAGAFMGLTQLETVTLPEGLELIANEAFSATPLSAISLPQSLKRIDEYAFRDTRLTRVDLGPNVESVTMAFALVPTLETITVSADNPWLTSVDGALYDKEVTTLIVYPSAAAEVSLPATVTTIGSAAFYGSRLTEIVIPDNVTTLGDDVFNNAQMLRRVVLPANLRVVPNTAFCNCYSLEEVVFNKALRNVESWAFYCCYPLRSITLHSNVKRLGDYAFQMCSSMSEITCLAQQAPAIASTTFANLPEQGVLTVPEGSDYSTWLDVLGEGWTVAYTEPEEPDPNGSWDGDVRVGYVNDGALWSDNPTAPLYAYYYSEISAPVWRDNITMECAIRVDEKANALARALGTNGRTLNGLSFKGSSSPVTGGKVWVATSLPTSADEADIAVIDITTACQTDEWNDILFEQPVVLPDGPCYVGMTLVGIPGPQGLYWPFAFQSLSMADALDGDCFVRCEFDGSVWKEGINLFDYFHQVPAVRLCLDGHFMENDVAPLAATDVALLTGREGTTTLALLQMGSEGSIGTIGVRYYDAASGKWGDTKRVTVGRTADNFGQRFYAEVPVPAKDVTGAFVDSLAVTEINGYPCPHSTLAVPVTVNVLSQGLKHVHLVEFAMMANSGACTAAEVGRKLLEQTMGDEVVTYTDHWGDDLPSRDKYPPLTLPGLSLDARYLEGVDPYYGKGYDGFGLADYLRSVDEQPAVAEIKATAVWRNESRTSLRLNSTIHTLIDLPEDRLSVRYYVVANGLHMPNEGGGQANALAGMTTDDVNLQPLTEQPAFISDYVFDGVAVFCPWYETSIESGERQRMVVPQMTAGSTVELQHCIVADPNIYGDGGYMLCSPEAFGIDYDNMYVIACIEDNLTRRIVNSVRVPLTAAIDIQADCVTAVIAEQGGQVQLGDEQGRALSATTAAGEQLTLTAIPDPGYRFSYWRKNLEILYENPLTFAANDKTVFTAWFEPEQYNVLTYVDGEGTVSGPTPDEWFNYGSTLTLTATPGEGYVFSHWQDDEGNVFTDNPLTYILTRGVILTAYFDVEDGIQTLSVADAAGLPLYDLQGRRVLHPVPGLYLLHRRKVLIR